MSEIQHQGLISQAIHVINPAQDFEERGTDEQVTKLYCALAAARANFGPIARSKTVNIQTRDRGSYKFDYAPLEELTEACTKALSEQGLVVLFPFTRTPGANHCTQRLILAHRDGARLVFSFAFESKGDVKEFGGQCTYMQRYAYRAALGLAAGEDLDDMPEESRGETGASSQNKRQEPRRTPDAPKVKPAEQKPAMAPQAAAAPAQAPVTPPVNNHPGPEPKAAERKPEQPRVEPEGEPETITDEQNAEIKTLLGALQLKGPEWQPIYLKATGKPYSRETINGRDASKFISALKARGTNA
jgi:hypothetical protein